MEDKDTSSRSRSNSSYGSSSSPQYGEGGLYNATITPNEDWTLLTDPVERRRVQNRIAQRGYRNRLKNSKKHSGANTNSQDTNSASASRTSSPVDPGNGAIPRKDQYPRSSDSHSNNGTMHQSLTQQQMNHFLNNHSNRSSNSHTDRVGTHHHYVPRQCSDWEPPREDTPCQTCDESSGGQAHNFIHEQQPTMGNTRGFSLSSMSSAGSQGYDGSLSSMSSFQDLAKPFLDPHMMNGASGRAERTPIVKRDEMYLDPSCYESSLDDPSDPSNISALETAYPPSSGGTALHRAAFHGHESVVEVLLENGADADARNRHGLSTLHLVCLKGHTGLVRLLLDTGADCNARNRAGKTALHLAAAADERAVVKLLLGWKGRGNPPTVVDVNLRDSRGWTALHAASERGHQGVVRLLIERGADIDMRDMCGLTALHQASILGREATVKLLLEMGADIHAKSDKG